jgi:hypothetical protein
MLNIFDCLLETKVLTIDLRTRISAFLHSNDSLIDPLLRNMFFHQGNRLPFTGPRQFRDNRDKVWVSGLLW